MAERDHPAVDVTWYLVSFTKTSRPYPGMYDQIWYVTYTRYTYMPRTLVHGTEATYPGKAV